MEKAFATQITNLDTKITDLKDVVTGRNWPAVGGYIVGALGIAGLIIAAIEHHS